MRIRSGGHAGVGRDDGFEHCECAVGVRALEEVADFDLADADDFLGRGDVHSGNSEFVFEPQRHGGTEKKSQMAEIGADGFLVFEQVSGCDTADTVLEHRDVEIDEQAERTTLEFQVSSFSFCLCVSVSSWFMYFRDWN